MEPVSASSLEAARESASLNMYKTRLGNLAQKLEQKRKDFNEILGRAIQEEKEKSKKVSGRALRSPAEDKKLLEASYDMEALFISMMLKSMRKTIPESNFFGKSLAKDIFSDMLYDEYAKIMAKTDQFGLAREIYAQLHT